MSDVARRWAPRILGLGSCPCLISAALLFASFVAGAEPVGAQAGAFESNRCADCHVATVSPNRSHVTDWQLSAHGRHGVGCEDCHGGDASTFDAALAHRDVGSSSNPSSPVFYSNLPKTCGSCHEAQLEAFAQSRHFELLDETGWRAPSCSTCHTDAGAFLLSSRGLERQCKRCHGAGKRAPHPENPSLARSAHENLVQVREMLEPAVRLISSIEDDTRRARLEQQLEDAQAPLTRAAAAAHAFTYDSFEELLAESRERVEEVWRQLANPEGDAQ